ncbi:uncharacterized protein LODBEIA_P33280 [Lodderomyces beijingensis]|uniref:C2H2-type domain-containing protein n=1 Tax=Lodderomyces beijingensis TaxID=1775926 RepID=A0ABP0ZLS9_9ASCO
MHTPTAKPSLISNLISLSASESASATSLTGNKSVSSNTSASDDKKPHVKSICNSLPVEATPSSSDETSTSATSPISSSLNFTAGSVNKTSSLDSTTSHDSRSSSSSSSSSSSCLDLSSTSSKPSLISDGLTTLSPTSNNDKIKPSPYTRKGPNYGTKTLSGHSRIYNCQLCQRAFTREEHLSRHVLSTHNKLKPFTCGICARPFSRRDLLLRHAKNLHKGSEKAITRIRRTYKHGMRDAMEMGTLPGINGSGSEEEEMDEDEEMDEEEEDMIEEGEDIEEQTARDPTTAIKVAPPLANSIGAATAPTSDDSVESKRLKMSVNMLVS